MNPLQDRMVIRSLFKIRSLLLICSILLKLVRSSKTATSRPNNSSNGLSKPIDMRLLKYPVCPLVEKAEKNLDRVSIIKKWKKSFRGISSHRLQRGIEAKIKILYEIPEKILEDRPTTERIEVHAFIDKLFARYRYAIGHAQSIVRNRCVDIHRKEVSDAALSSEKSFTFTDNIHSLNMTLKNLKSIGVPNRFLYLVKNNRKVPTYILVDMDERLDSYDLLKAMELVEEWERVKYLIESSGNGAVLLDHMWIEYLVEMLKPYKNTLKNNGKIHRKYLEICHYTSLLRKLKKEIEKFEKQLLQLY